MDIIRNRIKMAVNTLGSLRYSHRKQIDYLQIAEGDYGFRETVLPEEMTKLVWKDYQRDETWGGKDKHYWLRAEIFPDRELAGRELRVIVSTGDTDLWNTDNPQILVYVDGKLKGTMDMNHQELILTDGESVHKKYELPFYAYSNNSAKTNFFHVDMAVYEREVAELYYDLKVPFEAGELLGEEDLERIEAWKVLNDSIRLLHFRRPYSEMFTESVKRAGDYFREH